jgi:serine/threonine protein kinase/WD40 repeat protein/tetratricopeptide (TPR) repeat protein
MSETTSGSGRDLVEQLLESFLARLRRGERPSLEEYAARCPERADEIRELFPALVEMEQLKPAVEAATGPVARPSQSPEARVPPAAPHPDRLGDYRILRVIGQGGMGVVYEAEHETLKSRVALKVMHPRFRTENTYVRRFQTEARSAARLHHTNIVPVFGFGEHDGVCFYAMQYIAGVGLNHVLDDVRRLRGALDGPSQTSDVGERGDQQTSPLDASLSAATQGLLTGRFAAAPAEAGGASSAPTLAAGSDGTDRASFAVALDESAPSLAAAPHSGSTSSSALAGQPESTYFREIARLGAQVADALDYAHRQNVIHRDIKPSNLMLDAQGNVWVTDFGLAKLIEGEDLSQSHDLVGTLRYMAPERFQGVTDRRSDIYALGATLYELLSLRPAFAEPDQVQLIRKIANDAPPPMRQHDPRIPRDLETIVLRVLSKDPKDRCDKSGELRDELRRFLEGRPTRWRRVGPVEQFRRWCKRNPWLAAANITAATLTTILAIGSTIAAWIYRDQLHKLDNEQNKTRMNLTRALNAERTANDRLGQTQKAEREAQFALGKSLLSEGAALQHSGLIGQRFASLDRLARAAEVLRDSPEGRGQLPELRDHAIAALGLSDLRPRWQRTIGRAEAIACDRQLKRYAIMEDRTAETVVRRLDDDRELLRVPRPARSFAYPGLEFSSDRRYLLVSFSVAEREGWLDVWNVERRVQVKHERAGCRAWHPDAPWLVFTQPGKDGLAVWDLDRDREVKRVRTDFQPVVLQFDFKGERLAMRSSEEPHRLQVIEWHTGRTLATWTGQIGTEDMSWSRDGRLLAIANSNGQVFVWNVERGQLASVLQGHTDKVVVCRFATTGTLLVTHSWDGTTRFWDAATGDSLVRMEGQDFQGFSPDSRLLASRRDTTLGLVDVAHGQEVCTLNPGLIGNRATPRDSGFAYAADFSPDDRLAALATPAGVHLYDVRSGELLAELKTGDAGSVLFEPQGRAVITYGPRGLFRWPMRRDLENEPNVMRVGPPELLHEVSPHLAWPKAAWLPDQRTLAMIDNVNASVLLLDTKHAHPARSRTRMLSSGENRRMRSIAVSPDGHWAAAGGWKDRGIYVWDLRRGRLERILGTSDDHSLISSWAAFDPGGRWLVASKSDSDNDGYCFWEVGTWKPGPIVPRLNHVGWDRPAFSPDGHLMAVVASPQQIVLVEAGTGRTVVHLSPLQSALKFPLAFSHDGTRLIAATIQNTALMWDLRRIRTQLRSMDLDWDQPPYPSSEHSSVGMPPIRSIRVIGEILEPSARRAAELAALDRRLADHPEDGDALIERGWIRLRMAKAAEAVADLERGLRHRPNDTDALFLLAEAHRKTSNIAAARTAVERYLALAPEDVEARLFRGQMARRLDSLQEAVDDFSQALDANPDRPVVRFDRAQANLRRGRFQNAVSDLNVLIRRYPGDAELYHMRSQAHLRLGDRDKASADLKKVGEMIAGDAQQLNNLSWRLATDAPHLRDPKRALELARKAVALTPNTSMYLNTLGVALYRAGKFAEAETTLDKSLAAGDGGSDAFDLFFLAMARYKLRKINQARADFDRAIRWRRDHRALRSQENDELDDFQAEAQVLLDHQPPELPAEMFAPRGS